MEATKAIWEETATEETKLLYAGAAYMAGATKWVLLRRDGKWYLSTPDDGYFTLESEESVRRSFEQAADEGLIVSWGTRAHYLASIPIRVKSTRKVEVGLGSVFDFHGDVRVLASLRVDAKLFSYGFFYDHGAAASADFAHTTLQAAVDYAKRLGYKLIEAKGV